VGFPTFGAWVGARKKTSVRENNACLIRIRVKNHIGDMSLFWRLNHNPTYFGIMPLFAGLIDPHRLSLRLRFD